MLISACGSQLPETRSPVLMIVDVDDDYRANAQVDRLGIWVACEASTIRDVIARAAAFSMGVRLSSLTFDVRESFMDGPVHVTRGWRANVPSPLDQQAPNDTRSEGEAVCIQ